MTPGQFALLLKRYEFRRKTEDRRSGEVIALLFNVNRGAKTDAIDWTDVFPEWKGPMKPQSEDEMFDAMQAWVGPAKGLSN